MNFKNLFLYLAIFLLTVYTVQTLTMNRNHNKLLHKAKSFTSSLAHKFFNRMHLDDVSTPTDSAMGASPWVQELMDYILTDQDIANSLVNGTPLSPESAKKLQDYIFSSKSLRDFIMKQYDQKTTPDCLKKLNKEQKEKLVDIEIQQTNYIDMFNVVSHPDSNQKAQESSNLKIIDAIKKEMILGEEISKCYRDNFSQLSKES